MRNDIYIHQISENLSFILFKNEVISEHIKQNNFWNFNSLNLCSNILKNSNYGNVIDIGAGIGSFSIPLFLRNEEKFHFYCFEPIQTLFHQLCANIFINGINEIETFQNIISSETKKKKFKTLDLEISNNHGSFSFIEEYNQKRNIFSEKECFFNVKTLDSFEIVDVKLIKISVSGMENLVINGAHETIKNSNYPPILVQCWNDEWFAEERQSILENLNTIGYDFYHDNDDFLIFFKNEKEAEQLQRESKVWGNLDKFKIVEVESSIEEVLKEQKNIAMKVVKT